MRWSLTSDYWIEYQTAHYIHHVPQIFRLIFLVILSVIVIFKPKHIKYKKKPKNALNTFQVEFLTPRWYSDGLRMKNSTNYYEIIWFLFNYN